jgi:hypothetical protein
MHPRPHSILALLSFAACLALLVWWAHGLMGDEVWVRCVGSRVMVYGAEAQEAAGAGTYYFDPSISMTAYVGPSGLLGQLRIGPTTGWSFAGVEFYRDASRPVPMYRAVVVPIVYPVLLTALAPAVWVAHRLRRRRRVLAGHCAVCGYDLRGNESGRCPECGASSSPVAAAG